MSEPDLDDLVGLLVRAQAVEFELSRLRPQGLPGRVRGPLPVSPGVQAAIVASRSDRSQPDVLCLSGHSPAASLALGLSAVELAHEAIGNAEASARGRSPSGVPGVLGPRLLGAVDPPGTMVEVMAGVALAFRLRGEARAAILVDTFDASASGYWHEGLNLAAVQKAPLVLVVDGARRHPLSAAVDRLAARAPAYGIRAVRVEGDDPHLVLDAIAVSAERARAGDGTQLVEVAARAPDDPVSHLARLDPALAERLHDLRAAADVEARRAAAAAASAAPASVDDLYAPIHPALPVAPATEESP